MVESFFLLVSQGLKQSLYFNNIFGEKGYDQVTDR